MSINYAHHGGRHQVAVVHCPRICGDRLVHLSQDGPDSWVIRDFIAGQQLRRSPAPQHSHSRYRLDEIEAEVDWSEEPPYWRCDRLADWADYLRLRTMEVLGHAPVTSQPDPSFGGWLPL